MSLVHREDSIQEARAKEQARRDGADELELLRGCVLELAAKVYGEEETV